MIKEEKKFKSELLQVEEKEKVSLMAYCIRKEDKKERKSKCKVANTEAIAK